MASDSVVLHPLVQTPAYTRAWDEAVYGFVTVGNETATRKHRVAAGGTVWEWRFSLTEFYLSLSAVCVVR